MTAPLTALLERVEAATEGSRELDARIWQAMSPDQKVLFDGGDVRTRRPAEYGRLADFPLEGFGDWDGIAGHIGAPNLTASVDAVLALVERVLPAVWIRLDCWDGDPHTTAAILPKPAPNSVSGGIGATLPLAILAAMLKGLIDQAALASRDAAGPADAEGV